MTTSKQTASFLALRPSMLRGNKLTFPMQAEQNSLMSGTFQTGSVYDKALRSWVLGNAHYQPYEGDNERREWEILQSLHRHILITTLHTLKGCRIRMTLNIEPKQILTTESSSFVITALWAPERSDYIHT